MLLTWQMAMGIWPYTTACHTQTFLWSNCCWIQVRCKHTQWHSRMQNRIWIINNNSGLAQIALCGSKTICVFRSLWDRQFQQGRLYSSDAGCTDSCWDPRWSGGGTTTVETGWRQRTLQTGKHAHADTLFPCLMTISGFALLYCAL